MFLVDDIVMHLPTDTEGMVSEVYQEDNGNMLYTIAFADGVETKFNVVDEDITYVGSYYREWNGHTIE